jgi:tetratricopeptide (TPR) repeat protein
MKKVLILILILTNAGIVYGQLPVDYILKARAYIETGKADQAINLLTGAIALNNDSRLLTERADARCIVGDYSGAESDYNEANKSIPFCGEYGLSRIYALKGDAATALYHLGMNLSSSFKKTEKEIMLDPAFGHLENSSAWRQFWKKEWYGICESGISEIRYYISAGKIQESKDVLAELKNNCNNNDDIIYAESLINLSSGKYGEVIKAVSLIVASNPGNEKYLRILAAAQSGQSNPAGASVTYTKILDLDIADAELYLLRADCYRKTGETDKALKDILKYLDIYPGNKSAISLAGKVEAKSGDNLKALEYFSENLKLHPDDQECYIDRANAYFISESWDWAVKDYTMALDLKPGNPEVWLNKGIALLKSGRDEDACHDFRKSMSLGNKRAAEFISNNCIK